MRRLIGFSKVLFIGSLLVGEAAACSCHARTTPQEALQAADVVFYGRILEVREVPGERPYDGYRLARFAVVRSWKGTASSEIEVRTSIDSCGIGFAENTSMLIFAHHPHGLLHTNICSGSRGRTQAGPAIVALGRPQFIFEENKMFDDIIVGDDQGGGGLCGGPDNLAALQGLSFIFLGLLWRRRYRHDHAGN